MTVTVQEQTGVRFFHFCHCSMHA